MKYLSLYLCLIALCPALSAQTDTAAMQVQLGEYVVSATGYAAPRREVAQIVQTIGARQLAWQNAPTSADVLQNTGGILVQKSQGGGGSPIIRGFEANKVLIHVDGVRLNNAIFRGGHLQNVLRIDNSILEKVEILYGPSSVKYGSDALGGVMHFSTKQPILNQTGGSAFLRYSTAIEEKTGHLDVNFGGKKWASLSSFTYSDFGDIVQGKRRKAAYPDFGKRSVYAAWDGSKDIVVKNPDLNRQVGTAYSQYDLLQKIRYQPSEHVSHTLNFQYSNSSDVPRYDRLSELGSNSVPRFAEWYYGPEQRTLLSYTLSDQRPGRFFDAHTLIAAYQNAQESRHSRRFGNLSRKNQYEEVGVTSLEFNGVKKTGRHEWSLGAEAYLNQVGSTAHFTDVATGAETPSDTRYPDGGSTMNSFAVYTQDKLRLSDAWIAHAGLRFNYITLDATFDDKTFFPFPYQTASQRHGAFSGSLGLIYLPSDKTKVSLLASTGFRAPNVDDLAKVFETVPGTLIVPNPDLRPEYTQNGELSLSQWLGQTARLEMSAYYSHLSNAIVLDAFSFNGQDSILYEGSMSKVLASQNKREAFIAGLSAHLDVFFTPYLSLRGSWNYTRGRILEEGGSKPLDHIPPVFGQLALQFEKEKLRAECSWVFNGKKDIKDYLLNAEDNERYATPDGMPAWNALHLRLGYALHRSLDVQAACENLFDSNYRVFASGVSAPGRNVRLTLRTRF